MLSRQLRGSQFVAAAVLDQALSDGDSSLQSARLLRRECRLRSPPGYGRRTTAAPPTWTIAATAAAIPVQKGKRGHSRNGETTCAPFRSVGHKDARLSYELHSKKSRWPTPRAIHQHPAKVVLISTESGGGRLTYKFPASDAPGRHGRREEDPMTQIRVSVRHRLLSAPASRSL